MKNKHLTYIRNKRCNLQYIKNRYKIYQALQKKELERFYITASIPIMRNCMPKITLLDLGYTKEEVDNNININLLKPVKFTYAERV